jgi:hypothetical protein
MEDLSETTHVPMRHDVTPRWGDMILASCRSKVAILIAEMAGSMIPTVQCTARENDEKGSEEMPEHVLEGSAPESGA